MKLALMFLTASAAYFGGLSQRQVQTSKKYEACFDVSYSECSIFWRFISKIISYLQVFAGEFFSPKPLALVVFEIFLPFSRQDDK